MMRLAILAATLAAVATAADPAEPAFVSSRPAYTTIEPSLAAIQAAAATAVPLSPVSNVPGKAFDRIMHIWLENTNFNASAADPNMQWIASQGILLTNYFAVTHPSEPNYAASVAGDDFGMENDDFNRFPANISTVVDLLDTKGISWGEYQEHLPYAGFQGFNFSNQENYANDYVRKHNPLILFDSVVNNATRLSLIKNDTSFLSDLAAQTLPQWSFYTPNMTNDGHDTNVTFAAQWARNFLTPLLSNSYFMNNSLIILTFDESEVYTVSNNVFTVLLGGVIPSNLKGTTDSMYYNHYSSIASVSLNWGLPSLGRWDCDANVYALVANKTGYKNTNIDLTGKYFNFSYPGPMSDSQDTPGWWPYPDTTAKCVSGLGVLPSINATWGKQSGSYNYTNVFPYDGASGAVGAQGPPVIGSADSPSGTSGGGGSSTASASPSSSSGPAATAGVEWSAVIGVAGLVAAFL